MFRKLLVMVVTLVQFLGITCIIAQSLTHGVTYPLKARMSKNLSETDFVTKQSDPLTKFSVGTVIGSSECARPSYSQLKDVMWYAPAGLSTLSKYFDFLHLTLADRNASDLPAKIDTKVPIDHACRSDWKFIEEQLAIQQLEPFKYAAPTTLIFQIEFQAGKFKAMVDFDFVHRHSHNYTIGCRFSVGIIPEEPTPLVQTCKSIGGSVYIIEFEMNLEPPRDLKSHSLHYENDLKRHLETVNTFRVKILQRHPEASVYLHLVLTTDWESRNTSYVVTVFCNPRVQQINLYYEAIVSWARLNDIPITLKLAFDGPDVPFMGSWLSLLRPMKTKLGTSEDFPISHPSFVLRNYPEGINNWKVDPCVEWDQVLSNAPPNFQINTIGAIIDFDIQEHDTTSSLYGIMLQFVLNRFLSIEILRGNYGEIIIKTLKELNSQGLVGDRKKIFICYRLEKSYTALPEFIKYIDATNVDVIKGIHFELTAKLIENNELFSIILESLSYSKTEVNVGIVLESIYCMRFIYGFLNELQPEENLKFLPLVLREINYIICKETVNISSLTDKTYLGGLFDSHLYIKRAYNEFRPWLSVYFRVEINIELGFTKETMEPYLFTLSRFREFGIAYDVNYFLVNSFDNKNGVNQNGWWAIQNSSMLDNEYSYIEKESVYSNRPNWYPTVPENVNKVTTNESCNANIAITVTAVILGLLVGVRVFFYIRYRRMNKMYKQKVQEFLTDFKTPREGNLGGNDMGHIAMVEAMKFDPNDELSIANLNIDTQTVLRSGDFGKVYKGNSKGRLAAVKKTDKNCTQATFIRLLNEVNVLSYVGAHSNVVEFLGVYTKEIREVNHQNPLWLLLPYGIAPNDPVDME
ncbi:unnamed protein product [Orchesella dallaii]|uniref:Protein kinase domain-containing protein n=1 Tax=Orchesella dallaii TaxID=48710 RepID=A0ABP1RP68_9HEXA